MFGWEFPPHMSGGLGTACYGLTRSLVNHGVDIIFVLPKLWEDFTESHVRLVGANKYRAKISVKEFESLKEHITFLQIDSPLRPYINESNYQYLIKSEILPIKHKIETYSQITTDFEGGYGWNLMSEIGRYSVIACLIAQTEEFDIIHAHDWITYPAGIEAKRISGKPLIVHAHALEFDRSGENINQDVYNIEKAGLDNADVIIAVSHYTKNSIMKHYGIPDHKIRVVHNAVSKQRRLKRFRIKKSVNEDLVLFLGRITFQKGPDYFVEAAYKVLQRIKGVRFVMAGKGDMFERMVLRVAELRMSDNFHFLGFLDKEHIETIYAMSDVYVMPSVSEPFGITPLEAMVHNVPIILSKQSGVAEILDHAVKIDFWDVDKLAEKIIELLRYPELSKKMVEEGSKQLKNIKWGIAAEKTKEIYRELLSH
jgi:glycogen synthase